MTNKKTIILDCKKSGVFEQAIFILKDNAPQSPSIVAEAEKIVDNYVNKYNQCFFGDLDQKRKKRKRRKQILLLAGGFLCVLALCVAVSLVL